MTITTGAFDSSGIPQGSRNRLDDLTDVDIAEAKEGDTIVKRNGRWVPALGSEVSVGVTAPTDGTELWLDLADISGIAVLKYWDVTSETYKPIPTAPPPPIDPSTIDHGALADRTADDHPQYVLADGSRPITANEVINGLITGKVWTTGSFYGVQRNAVSNANNALLLGAVDGSDNTVYLASQVNAAVAIYAGMAYLFNFGFNGLLTLPNVAPAADSAVRRDYVETPTVTTFAIASGWADIGAAYAGLHCVKSAGFVTIECTLKPTASTTCTVGTGIIVGTVPVGFRPAKTLISTQMQGLTGGTTLSFCRVSIDTNGTLQFIPGQAGTMTTSGFVGIQMTYRQGA